MIGTRRASKGKLGDLPIGLHPRDASGVFMIRAVRSARAVQTHYLYECKDCGNELLLCKSQMQNATGFCKKCFYRRHADRQRNNRFAGARSGTSNGRRLRPFESMYNRLKKKSDMRGKRVTITYEDFLEFTKVNCCHYCAAEIEWTDYSRGRGYNLDRVDNALGYEPGNLVVCCRFCNTMKGGRSIEWFVKRAAAVVAHSGRANVYQELPSD